MADRVLINVLQHCGIYPLFLWFCTLLLGCKYEHGRNLICVNVLALINILSNGVYVYNVVVGNSALWGQGFS